MLVVSGAIWLVLHFFMVSQGEFGDAHHPLETWMLKLHGAAAMAGLIIYGSLLPIHIRRAWVIRRNIFLGISLVVLMLLLTISGYLILRRRRGSASHHQRNPLDFGCRRPRAARVACYFRKAPHSHRR